MGMGTVLGAAVFNQLINIGGSVLLSGREGIQLPVYSLARDLSFYYFSLALVMGSLLGNNPSGTYVQLNYEYVQNRRPGKSACEHSAYPPRLSFSPVLSLFPPSISHSIL